MLNGYKVIYKPGHPNAMTSNNWNGWVYEHIFIASFEHGRPLRKGEEVHHLDGNKLNNNYQNLIVLTKKSHVRLHRWLESCALDLKELSVQGMNSGKPKLIYCKRCKTPLIGGRSVFCSKECHDTASRAIRSSVMDCYSLEEVLASINNGSVSSASREYGISDNGLRKWLRVRHGISRATLSQALSTLNEGAETTGEVKSS